MWKEPVGFFPYIYNEERNATFQLEMSENEHVLFAIHIHKQDQGVLSTRVQSCQPVLRPRMQSLKETLQSPIVTALKNCG